MGSLGTALVCPVQFCAESSLFPFCTSCCSLQGATGLNVQQGLKLLQVRQDRGVTLTCQVVQPQAWEQLHVKFTMAGVAFCPPCITNSNLSLEIAGPRGPHSSGNYLCWTTMEMAESVEAKGNGTQLLVETGNALFSNILYRPKTPKKTESWPVEGKDLDVPREGQGHSFYSIWVPHPTPTPQHLVPKPCPSLSPGPSHPISTGRISPGPGCSRHLRSGRFLEHEREVRTP
ncbi:LOW QUALITY PROTEIN: transmembrane and immunoglobulin domain-containing protein 2 [Glossophaga mutica]